MVGRGREGVREKELLSRHGSPEPPGVLIHQAEMQKVWGRSGLCILSRLPRRCLFEKGCLSEHHLNQARLS